MLIFAIALVPEGNIIRQIRKASSFAFRSGDRPEASALPEGLYLGFYVPGPAGSDKDLTRSFGKSAAGLFEHLPPLLRFSSTAKRNDRWYITPDEPLPKGTMVSAALIAGEAGFDLMESPPLVPGAGFFAGNDVTPPPFGAFSFRHLDALLYRIETPDPRFDKTWWTVLARVPRRTGARGSTDTGSGNPGP